MELWINLICVRRVSFLFEDGVPGQFSSILWHLALLDRVKSLLYFLADLVSFLECELLCSILIMLWISKCWLFYLSIFVSSGFNAPVAGCFFAIETVLRPLQAENSPPFTTAMIILASVISSTVSNVLQGIQSAFTIPEYDLKSAAGIFL